MRKVLPGSPAIARILIEQTDAGEVVPPAGFSPVEDPVTLSNPDWETLGVWSMDSDGHNCYLEAKRSLPGLRSAELGLTKSQIEAVRFRRMRLIELSAICGAVSTKGLEDFRQD